MTSIAKMLKTAGVISLVTSQTDAFKNTHHNSFFKHKINQNEPFISNPNTVVNLTPNDFHLKEAFELIAPLILVGAGLPRLPAGPSLSNLPFIMGLIIYTAYWSFIGELVYRYRINHMLDLNKSLPPDERIDFNVNTLLSGEEEDAWNRLIVPLTVVSTYEIMRGATHVAVELISQGFHP